MADVAAPAAGSVWSVDPASGAVPDADDLGLAALDLLGTAVLVIAPDDSIRFANRAAAVLGLEHPGRRGPLPDVLAGLVLLARHDRASHEQEVVLPARDDLGLRLRHTGRQGPPARVRAEAIGTGGYVALTVEDLSEARRIEAVRRDFVANVSHELKTPVGALQLLAEALHDASDDPAAVQRFAARIGKEATRLGRLVQDVIDLSRLQGAEPPKGARVCSMQSAVAEAVDRSRLAAQAKSIVVVVVTEPLETAEPTDGRLPGFVVDGDEAQLTTTVANLLDNAVTYSPDRTRVVVGLRRRGEVVELSVADEGIGIAEGELERVFERFYRADPARARSTGGTGLGLAIVKHITANHGGEVTVWSAPGKGSTFTVRLPAARRIRPTGETSS